MSAATDFAPDVDIPTRTRLREQQAATTIVDISPHARLFEQQTATVIALQRPSDESVAAPLRLTRRGVAVLALAIAALSVGLVLVAWLSAPSAPTGRPAQPATVVVHDGDTLWSIASRVAPDRDPRVEVAELQRRNHLVGVELTPGQVLRTH